MNPTHYDIIDTQTGFVVGTAKTRTGARRSVDKRDNEYGAYHYRAVAIYDATEQALFESVRAAIL
jgi:hypothetical protein